MTTTPTRCASVSDRQAHGLTLKLLATVLFVLALLMIAPATSGAAPHWSDGVMKTPIQNLNCTSIIQGSPYPENEVAVWVSQYIDEKANPASPVVGEVFDVRVIVGTIGNNCSGTAPKIELALPPGVTPAISAQHRIYCYWTNNFNTSNWPEVTPDQGCPATLGIGMTNHPSVTTWHGVNPDPAHYGNTPLWLLPQGSGIEIRVPVVADRTMSGIGDTSGCSCVIAAVETINGTSMPEPSFSWSSGSPTGPAYQHLFVWPNSNAKNPDKNPFAPKIKAPKRAKVGRKIKLTTTCPSGCKIKMQLKIGKKKVKGLKSVIVNAGSKSVAIKLPKKVVEKVKRLLRKSKKTKVTLTLTPTSAAGKGKSRSIRIRR